MTQNFFDKKLGHITDDEMLESLKKANNKATEQKRPSGYYWVQLQFDVGLPNWLVALYAQEKNGWYLPGVDGKTVLPDSAFSAIDLNEIKRKP